MNSQSGPCYLCNQNSLEVLHGFSWLVECQNCGIIYNPDLAIDSKEVSGKFYDDQNARHRERIRSVLRIVARSRWRWLQKRISLQVGRLLEIGCGTGEFLVTARDAGWHVEGLELSEKFRHVAKIWYNLELQEEELAKVDYQPQSFDVVALLHVFEHVPNPLELLDQIYKILIPGGWLLIIVPNVSSWTDSLFGKASPVLIKKDHFFHYNKETLQKLVAQSQFRTVDIVTLEPQHHIWTSLYGYLSLSRSNRMSRIDELPILQAEKSLISTVRSNLPYWVGSLGSVFLFPMRFWLRKSNKGHEIYLLCRRPQ